MRVTKKEKAGSRHVALLRGVNIGTAKRVAMADLRTLVAGLGYSDVSTLLNSGNVVFTSPKGAARESAARIEKALKDKLGLASRTIGLDSEEMAVVIAQNTLLKIASNPSRLLVAVFADPADRSKLAPLLKQDWGHNVLAVGSRAAYLWLVDGVTPSKLNTAVNKTLGEEVTSRNWATVLKLKAMMDGQGDTNGT